jgi:FKBP-type peptidyl-prolyl cis-trans isomerase
MNTLMCYASPALLAFSLLCFSPSVLAKKVEDATEMKAVTATAAPKLPNIPAPADVGKPPADAEKSASGLTTKVLQKGTGKVHPTEADIVEVNYWGWQQRDGYLFDTSQKRGTTAKFPLKLLIKGWREGLTLMVVGEKRRMWIPANMAYGDKPRAPGKAYGDLCFDVELVNIHPGEESK